MDLEHFTYTPSQFVSEYNQALETVFPIVVLEGELLNYKIARNKWVYADIADDTAKLRLFGSVFRLKYKLEDGMRVRVVGRPRLSSQYGLSIDIEAISPLGEGDIKKAASLLEKKLAGEGLFDESRKRSIAQYPTRIGLLTSLESAAYADFIKIMNARWGGVEVIALDSVVQGDNAVESLVSGLAKLNEHPDNLDAIVLIRGGGSPEDLQAFSAETLVRAVASSRTPIVSGIGHEIDSSLVERAADLAASTPSNAAELVFPSRIAQSDRLQSVQRSVLLSIKSQLAEHQSTLESARDNLHHTVDQLLQTESRELERLEIFLRQTHPQEVLKRGYALLRDDQGQVVSSIQRIMKDKSYEIEFADGKAKLRGE